jgi:hypothetical protein
MLPCLGQFPLSVKDGCRQAWAYQAMLGLFQRISGYHASKQLASQILVWRAILYKVGWFDSSLSFFFAKK